MEAKLTKTARAVSCSTLSLPSTPDSLVRLHQFLESYRKITAIDEKPFLNVIMAITEAVSNGIIHGNNSILRKFVQITIRSNGLTCFATVEDEGNGFDYSDFALNVKPDPGPGPGNGLYIMRIFSDDIYFSKNGTCVNMQFSIAD